jgi:tetratricopeptide (TPR) repeat protein
MNRKLQTILIWTLLLAGILGAERAQAQLNKYYFYWAGQNYMRESKYRDAIETLNILLRTDPGAYEAYFLRGVAKYNLDDLHGAEQDFSLAIGKNPVHTMSFHYRAIARSRLGNYDDALKDFHEAIELRPDRPGPYYSRGVTYLLSQQFEAAIRDFNEFLKFEPKVADAHINKGTAYLYLKDTVSALESYNRAIETYSLGPDGYIRRGALYLSRRQFDDALADFNTAIGLDSLTPIPWFNRAIVYANTQRPLEAISDLDRVIGLDSTLSISYFNRALLRSQIGDYNRALEDYDRVATLNPNNVLVFYNRAGLNAELGRYDDAIRDYTEAIDLYPDFANAYLNRSGIRYYQGDVRGAQTDRSIAEQKIAEYRSKLTDSTFSIYADTSRHFNQLLSFDPIYGRSDFSDEANADRTDITLLSLFRFSLYRPSEGKPAAAISRYGEAAVEDFIRSSGIRDLALTNRETNIETDSLIALDENALRRATERPEDWKPDFERGITQALIRQYTNSINNYTKAIELDPSNPYLYINRSTTRAEMIDFISSIDNSYQKITIDSDPVNRLKNTGTRTYNYDEAIHDLNKAAKLFPGFAHIYYNRANLHCLSGNMPEAYDDYTRAIELFPDFAEAYYNRGLVQIYLKDTRKGALDISKAGELGVEEAYEVLRRYGGGN